jgi:hypothetical protein
MIRGAVEGQRSRQAAAPGSFAALVALIVAVLLAGTACSSGAFRGPDSRSGDTSDRESTGAPDATDPGSQDEGGPAPVTYGYSLPEGDTSNADDNGVMYSRLAQNRCADAQAYLDQVWAGGFQSPEEVLMFQVGTSMCAGDAATAAAQFDRGERLYGWTGLAGFGRNLCNIYRAYLSYRDQRPQEDISCPGGSLEYWPGWPEPQPRDDPRTDAVEATWPDGAEDAPAEPDDGETPPSEPVPSPPDEPEGGGTPAPPTGPTEPETTPAPGSAP